LTAWSFGNDPDKLANYAIYNETETIIVSGGSKQATGLGFYDIYGNLYEYVSDWYHQDYGLATDELAGTTVNPKGPNSGTQRIVRGGTYYQTKNGWGDIRSASRASKSNYDTGNIYIGFRLLLEIPNEAR
jgi:formylglycine-generating enzyme required for sulfatase activity